jgi:hypothetical protein
VLATITDELSTAEIAGRLAIVTSQMQAAGSAGIFSSRVSSQRNEMTRYLVFFETPDGGWRVPRTTLMTRLASDWPGATLVPAAEMGVTSMRDVGWTYAEDDADIEGWSAASGSGISLEGDDDLAARFAAWYRELVPDHITVRFSDAMYSFDLVIPGGASADEVAEWLAQA